jgi:hypothetical protein
MSRYAKILPVLALAMTMGAGSAHAQTTASTTTTTTTTIPGTPNTGAGGDAAVNYAILAATGLVAVAGVAYLNRARTM